MSDPIAAWRAGDQEAARKLVDQYLDRLVAVARRRISQRLASRVDPEDVVQSVFRTFFLRAKDGQFKIKDQDDLCKLLMRITVHKVLKQVEYHTAGKRDANLETEQGNRDEPQFRGRACELHGVTLVCKRQHHRSVSAKSTIAAGRIYDSLSLAIVTALFTRLAALVAGCSTAVLALAAQSTRNADPVRPDLDGVWDFSTRTPLQRMPQHAAKAFLELVKRASSEPNAAAPGIIAETA